MENLNTLVVFAKVAETRSFTEAAKLLGLTPSGISKSITRLEKEMGVRLLQRTTRSVGMTDDGARFFEHCQMILANVAEAEASLMHSRILPAGKLRVHLPVGFGRRVIVPALTGYLARYPELRLDAELSDRSVDLVYEGFDAAVLIGQPADTRLIARKLCHLRFVACASPDYLARHGEPRTPDELDHHQCLAYALPHSGRYREWQFVVDGKPLAKTVSGNFNVNNAESLLEAAMAGMGIAMISNFIAADAIRAGRLQGILTDFAALGPPVSVVYLPARQISPRVRSFVDFLVELIPPHPTLD